ncbi:17586_t:CDS:2, partial [Funneliformis geosporum]
NLRKKTLRARKHLMLFGKNGVGIDKIKLVSYSATEISKLTNSQIQNVVDQVKMITSGYQSHVTLNTVPQGNDQIKAEDTVPQYEKSVATQDYKLMVFFVPGFFEDHEGTNETDYRINDRILY